ncbi:MAG: hypothetical protein V3T49_05845 [Dehalococcoidia bacterium]
MTNAQTRMLVAAIGLLAGTIASQTDNLDINVGLVIILLSGAALIGEYIRSFKE